jgi:hypothetical protein
VKQGLIAFAVLAGCAFAGSAGAAIPKDQYQRQLQEAQGRYKAANDTCKTLAGNARDICKVEARGNYNVAKAELNALYKPSPKSGDKVKMEKAEAAWRLASEKCDDMSGNAKDICRLDAKTLYVAAKSEAKLSRASVDNGVNSRKANDERKEARDKNGDAQFAAAKERCDNLTGDAKTNCIGDVKKKFGKM